MNGVAGLTSQCSLEADVGGVAILQRFKLGERAGLRRSDSSRMVAHFRGYFLLFSLFK